MTTLDRVNILIVDDRPENLLALENVLKSPELNVIRATSGNEALAKLLEIDFACVLLDVQMPGMDGFEVAKIIREDERTRLIPIIFSSGQQRAQGDVFKGYETGAVDYLLKPLDATVVRSKVNVFAELYRKGVALKRAETSMAEYARALKLSNDELETRVADRMKELSNSRAQTAQLQKMDAIGSLAGGVAHDFNNILAAISMYCDLAADSVNSPETVIDSIDEIRGVAARGAALTRQLLIFSRKQIVQPASLKLNDLVQGMLQMLTRLIGENIEICTALDPGLDLIRADPGQVEQVILNLIVNARDAMADGGKITLETSNILLTKDFSDLHVSVLPGPHVVLSVADTGSGMDEATRAHLFEPFFTTKPVGKGTGLGLSTVFGIVKQAKGTVWVYSEPGKGSVFKVYFPVAGKSLREPARIVESGQKARIGGTGTVLLVEDDARLRSLFSKALKSRGFQVTAAADGKEALEAIERRSDPLDLLLTDVIMPSMGGFELARKALGVRPNLQIVFMSGYANESIEEQAGLVQQRAVFIQKPFDTDALVTKIQEALAR